MSLVFCDLRKVTLAMTKFTLILKISRIFVFSVIYVFHFVKKLYLPIMKICQNMHIFAKKYSLKIGKTFRKNIMSVQLLIIKIHMHRTKLKNIQIMPINNLNNNVPFLCIQST